METDLVRGGDRSFLDARRRFQAAGFREEDEPIDPHGDPCRRPQGPIALATPAVARAGGALDGVRRVARDPERRMRLLDGRWAGPHRRQAVARAREVGVAAAPERPADREVLLGPPAAPGKRHAERLELLAEPAGARGEDYTATREDVERGDLLRRDHGVAIRDDVRAD